MKVNEIFFSIQGEGILVGLPTVFVRFAGCNLRCSWCDTKYAYHDFTEIPIDDILRQISSYKCKRVSLTGGEPLLQPDLEELIQKLVSAGYEVLLETNGTIDLSSIDHSVRISMDVKSLSSGCSGDALLKNLDLLSMEDQCKFVVADQKDVDYALSIVNKFSLDSLTNVVFTPVFGIDFKYLVRALLDSGADIRLGIQMHKILFGEMRGV